MIRRTAQSARAAFTLVELLVVIAIIAIIMGLTGAAYFWFVSNQGIKNTKARIEGIDKVFLMHWNKVINDAKKESPSDAAYQFSIDSTGQKNAARDQVIWVKARLTEAFPMTYNEIQNPSVYAGATPLIPPEKRKYNTSYKKMLGSLTSANNPVTESAACLLIALSVSHGGTPKISDEVRGYTADTDNDGIQEFIDDYRQPLLFFRFPTDNQDLKNSTPAAVAGTKNRDPLDSFGTLRAPAWYNAPPTPTLRNSYESMFHQISFDNGTNSFYTIPVIMSAGPDGKLGLNMNGSYPKSDMSINNAGDAADNMYSFKLQVGG